MCKDSRAVIIPKKNVEGSNEEDPSSKRCQFLSTCPRFKPEQTPFLTRACDTSPEIYFPHQGPPHLNQSLLLSLEG